VHCHPRVRSRSKASDQLGAESDDEHPEILGYRQRILKVMPLYGETK
jgi:hypothetical protein